MNKNIFIKNLSFIIFFIICLPYIASCKGETEDKDNTITADKKEVFSFDLTDIIGEEFYNIKYYNDELYILCDSKIYVLSISADKLEIITQIDLPKKYNNFEIGYKYAQTNTYIYLADIENRVIDEYSYNIDSRAINKSQPPEEEVLASFNQIPNDYIIKLPENINVIHSMNLGYGYKNAPILAVRGLTFSNEDDGHDHGENLEQQIYLIDIEITKNCFSLVNALKDDVVSATFLSGGKIGYIIENPENYNALYMLDNTRDPDNLSALFENLYFGDMHSFIDSKKLSSSLGNYYIENIFYDEENNFIWYFMNGTIYYYSIDGGNSKTFCDIDEYIPKEYRQFVCNDIFISSDKIIATHYPAKMVYVISASKNQNEKNENETDSAIIKILVNDSGLTKMQVETIKGLIYETYGVNAEITAYNGIEQSEDKIATKLLAGDTDFDIYTLAADYMPYYTKNNACYDLSSAKEIIDNFEHMFDGLKDVCSVGSKLCGVPLYLNIRQNLWDCNLELAEILNIDIEKLSTEKMTWKEFYDFAVKIKTKAEEFKIEDFYVLSAWGTEIDHRVWDYMTNYLDYTNKKVDNKTAEYIEYLKLYMKMQDEGLISKELKIGNADGSTLFSVFGIFDYIACESQPFPQPFITAGDSYLVNTVILAINPNSPNIEAAKKYIEYSISLPVLKKRVSDYLLKDWDLYEYFEEELVAGENGVEVVTTEKKMEAAKNGHEVIAFMVKNGKRHYGNSDIWSEMNADATLMTERKLSIDEYAQKLYNKSKMIIEE